MNSPNSARMKKNKTNKLGVLESFPDTFFMNILEEEWWKKIIKFMMNQKNKNRLRLNK